MQLGQEKQYQQQHHIELIMREKSLPISCSYVCQAQRMYHLLGDVQAKQAVRKSSAVVSCWSAALSALALATVCCAALVLQVAERMTERFGERVSRKLPCCCCC
jgi:hypothetical protein